MGGKGGAGRKKGKEKRKENKKKGENKMEGKNEAKRKEKEKEKKKRRRKNRGGGWGINKISRNPSQPVLAELALASSPTRFRTLFFP